MREVSEPPLRVVDVFDFRAKIVEDNDVTVNEYEMICAKKSKSRFPCIAAG